MYYRVAQEYAFVVLSTSVVSNVYGPLHRPLIGRLAWRGIDILKIEFNVTRTRWVLTLSCIRKTSYFSRFYWLLI